MKSNGDSQLPTIHLMLIFHCVGTGRPDSPLGSHSEVFGYPFQTSYELFRQFHG